MMTEPYINKLTIDLLLESLPAEDRDIISLYFIEGYSIKEIPKIINKRYHHRANAREIGAKITQIIRNLRENVGVEGTYSIVRRRKTKKSRNME